LTKFYFLSKKNHIFVQDKKMTAQDDIIQQEILHVALRLYRKFGFTKVTMDNLAKATGRSRSSLYYYFKNRDEVFQAVLNQVAADVAAEISKAAAAANGIEDKLYAFCLTKVKTTQDWKLVFNAIDKSLAGDEQSKHMQFLDALHTKLIFLEKGILMEILSTAEFNDKRVPTNAELDMLAFLVSSGIRGVRREVYDHNDPHDIKIAARLLSNLVTKWLQY